jgi:hypothetical protein
MSGHHVVLLLIATTLGCAAAGVRPSHETSSCHPAHFRGFDSRLVRERAGTIPPSRGEIIGLEIVDGRVVAASDREIFSVSAVETRAWHGKAPIAGLAVAGRDRLRVSYGDAFFALDRTGFTRDLRLDAVRGATLFGSGHPVFLEARGTAGETVLTGVRADGSRRIVGALPGTLRALSWNDAGLAAVAGDSLSVWPAALGDPTLSIRSRRLEHAGDVCAIGNGRAIVAFPEAIVMFSSTAQVIVATFPALCRYHDDTLYVLEKPTGTIWRIHNLDGLGDADANRRHAQQLATHERQTGGRRGVGFDEAARLVGCRAAEAQWNAAAR